MLLLFVAGDVLGAGIYALVGTIGDRGGGAIWASFLGRRGRGGPRPAAQPSARAVRRPADRRPRQLAVSVVASMAVPTEKMAASDGPLLEVVQPGRSP
jgi:hypothetical protein